jgi:hypothetical protein
MPLYPYKVRVVYTPGDNYEEVIAWIAQHCKGEAMWEYITPG